MVESLKKKKISFRHFDKEKTGRLNHQEFKSCLRALGYDLPMVEEGQIDPEFETIVGKDEKLDFVFPLSNKFSLLHSYRYRRS